MQIKWSNEAELQLQCIVDYYVSVAGPRIAKHILDKIDRAVAYLSVFPELGIIISRGKIVYRSLVAHPNYKVIYHVEEQVVFISAIWDCRQDPARMDELFL